MRNRTGLGGRISALLAALLIPGLALSATATRTSAFEYDPTTGLLTKEIIEPDLPQYRLETSYTYDAYGNRTATQVSSPATGQAAITTRSTSTGFDSRGQFPVSSTNALLHQETRTYDASFGVVKTLTGPNALTTTWDYDSFGRKVLETRADGNKTKWEYLYCNGFNGGTTPCPSLARYVIATTPLNAANAQNGAWSKTYFDALDREIRTESQGFDGASVFKDTEYDNLGRVSRVSNPYFSGATIYWTVTSYDVLGRVIQVQLPDNSTVTTSYNGLETTTTNALGQTQKKLRNSHGQVVQVTDAANSILSLQYDPYGNLTKTTDPLGNITTLVYDQRGRKVQMIDPDMGTWDYAYNALGELVWQRDAKQQVVTMAYDLLGRMTSRVEPDLTSNWTFDSCPYGKGKPCGATTTTGYVRSHSYDSLGRPNGTTTSKDTTYTTSTAYNSDGRVATQVYPTGFAVKYVYNSWGFMQEVRNNDASNALFWRADVMDARGSLLQETYGNNLQTQRVYEATTGRLKNIYAGAGNSVQNMSFAYDMLGNLQSRTDAIQNLVETFGYDNLNRLTSATVNSGATLTTQSFTYNAIGNILTRSDVGSYSYGAANARPHAVSEVQLAAGGKRVYAYDANGNLAAETQYDASNNVLTNKGRIEIYTSFNMPVSLGAPGVSLAFSYGPEHQRVMQTAMTATTYYLHPDNEGGLLYEKDLKADGSTEHKHFITAMGQVVALVKRIGTTDTVLYMHRDHLGSTSAISNSTGAVVERLAYEAFGKRRFPAGTTDPNNTIVGVNTDRGFTNHEHLEELGLIHMNGRIYDPWAARFMSPDPHHSNPNNLQAYNRFSYVHNNPLNSIDPSGYWSLIGSLQSAWKSVWNNEVGRVAITVAVAYFTGYYNFGTAAAPSYGALGTSTLGLGNAMAGGFAGGLVGSGGDVAAGIKGAFTASLFYGAGSFADMQGWATGGVGRTAAHAIAGCIGASASGGDCGSGALAAGFAEGVGGNVKLARDEANLIARTVIGGTASVIGGGKFSNGAITASFGYIFNHCGHDSKCFTTGEERALLNQRDFAGYYKLACQGSDIYACQAGDIAAGKSLPAVITTVRLIDYASQGGTLPTQDMLNDIRLKLAVAYANYLGDSSETAKIPSAMSIAQIHWNVFAEYNIPPRAFGGTPLGTLGGTWFTKQYPAFIGGGTGWCPKCAP